MKLNSEVVTKIIRKKVLWAEVKAKEQEYRRVQNQINDLEQAKRDMSFDVQKRLDEAQQIAEWLDVKEYEAMKDLNS